MQKIYMRRIQVSLNFKSFARTFSLKVKRSRNRAAQPIFDVDMGSSTLLLLHDINIRYVSGPLSAHFRLYQCA